ncbi:hypothetical protein HKD37_03G006895 [Glycine soja]
MAETEPSSANLDHLGAAMTKLATAQLLFVVTRASMDSKLDVFLMKLNTMVPSQPSPSSSSAKSPPPVGTMPPLLLMVTSQFLPSSSSTRSPPTPETMPTPLPMATSHLPANGKPHESSSDPHWAAIH